MKLDTSDNKLDIGGARVSTHGYSYAAAHSTVLPVVLQAAAGSTSVYVAGIAIDAADYGAADDLDLVFHIEFLD